MPAGPGSQNAKTILGVVVGHSLDEARQHFLGQRFRLRKTHADYPRSRRRAHQTPISAEQQAGVFRCKDAQDRLDNGGFAEARPAGYDLALLEREPDGQRVLAAERERRKMATGCADSRCQTIAATAPVSPRKLRNEP
jgi:hypothetical protein